MSVRTVAGVTGFWLVVGVLLGSQAALGMTLQGDPVELTAAVRTNLINWLPWIPVSLAAMWMAGRVPVTREGWRRTLWIHLLAIPVLSWVANLLVVAGFWWTSGTYNGLVVLARQGALWGTLRIHVAVTVYASFAAGTQIWSFYRATKDRELQLARLEAQLARARFQALNEQIRPHFLFNTLHTIGQLWRSGRADDADAMLDHLGALFQKVRASTESTGIPLGEELSMVGEYLAIEEARFPDRLKVTVDASPEARICTVPPLLLQPLVENAVRHGVSVSPDAGRIQVRGRVDGETLILEVADDGPGMANASPVPGSGTGLSNTRERLEHAYGDAQSLEIGAWDGRGTLVRLRLPARPDSEARWQEESHG